ncbi:CPBP family intramembrane metalloprotease [Nocardiopsis sp. RSe5-2]|uniref:CPBP family intramembrane metalloprotease n=1 Tax=Nocardiopsis endophytica TaxID=3018445 RepID=A0ABT4UAG6_9ACTN|nr:CPBP family intramembrane glutamic endopeptidase [Nocardiopsis endophytica]MDA2813962.1 CPBP family intramembrane metalloprotease [Nocardiopsis endophytica]
MSATGPDHLTPPTGSAASASPLRPGWPEIAVGLLGLVVATSGLFLFGEHGPVSLDPVAFGLVVAAWSGIAGLVGFGAAYAVRRRPLAAFGVRRTTWRWMLVGVVAGVVALGAKTAVNAAIISFTDFEATNPQGMYFDAAGGGALPLVLTFLFLAILTPIGEEFLFRGVVTNALLRYGPLVGVLGSSAVFAVFHGLNYILPSAFIVGVIAAEVMRRSGSIWPAVAVHTVNNTALPLLVLFTQGTSAA